MKKNKISKNWLKKRNRDYFFINSKIQGYRSRSAYKLIEMDNKFKFLKKNSFLLDLGSSPGGWSQVAIRKIKKGRILAVDIKPMDKIDNVDFLKGNFYDPKICSKIKDYFNNRVDIILSDMAANTTGNKNLDTYRTGELCLKTIDLAEKILHQGGVLIFKVLMGSIFTEINKRVNKCFKKVVIYKPLSSKKESKEIYVYCKKISKSFNFFTA